MQQDLFFPVYKQLEREFKELSFYISIDKKQLKVYSIKIADLILRTVSEVENIAKELCKKEGIKFYNKNKRIRKVVYFNEYIDELNKKFRLEKKHVNIIFENMNKNTFDSKNKPFYKDKEIKTKNKDKKSTYSWYDAYNKIKHDRVKNFKYANIENLIYSLEALFLLNIYYIDESFYFKNEYDANMLTDKIEAFSDIFKIDYTVEINKRFEGKRFEDSFFNPYLYFEIAEKHSVYKIYNDKLIKTESDEGKDFMEKLDSKTMLYNKETGELRYLHDDYQFNDNMTLCSLVAEIIRYN